MSVSEPGKIITPWAESGLKNPIPPAANPATGRAGFDQGFSAINMTAKEAGGIPPFGQDFNGIFYEVTNILRYMQAGGQPTFDAALATAIGGYPKGAMVLGSDGVTLWQSKVDSNSTNPNTDPSGWGTFDIGLKADLAAPTGAELVGINAGDVDRALNGGTPVGPTDPVDWYYGGPMIRRSAYSIEDMAIFVDPAAGIDTNPGTQAQPIKTIKEAVQRLPERIFHKIRIYLLDGTYPADDNLRLFNYYVTSRGRAGLRFVGHIAMLDGEPHPIYTDTNPDAVVVQGFEHMTSGIRGTEELYFAGITFKNGWYEGYDSYALFVSCKFTGGHRSVGYNSYHAISGHYCQMDFINCGFSDLAQIGTLTNFANATFENCTLSGLHMTSDAANPGRPFACSNRSTVYIRNSPQLLQTGPGGKSITTTGGHIFDFLFSSMGYNALRRNTPDRDESLYVLGHDGGGLGTGRGAGIEVNGVNHPTNPGRATVEITGTNANSKFRVVHDTGGAPIEVLGASRFGEVTARANILFSAQQRALSTHLQDGQATLYTNPTTGDVFVVSKLGGVMKYTRLLEFATAPVLP